MTDDKLYLLNDLKEEMDKLRLKVENIYYAIENPIQVEILYKHKNGAIGNVRLDRYSAKRALEVAYQNALSEYRIAKHKYEQL